MLDFKIYLFVSILIFFILLIILRFFNLKQIQFKKDKSKNEKISVGCFYIILLFVVFGNIPGINQMFSFNKNYESHYVTVIDKKGDDDIIVAPWINTDKQKSSQDKCIKYGIRMSKMWCNLLLHEKNEKYRVLVCQVKSKKSGEKKYN